MPTFSGTHLYIFIYTARVACIFFPSVRAENLCSGNTWCSTQTHTFICNITTYNSIQKNKNNNNNYYYCYCYCHHCCCCWWWYYYYYYCCCWAAAPFQSMIYIALTFHSACEQVVIVIVNIEHSNDLIQAVTEGVKLSKNVVLREPKGCLPRKERLIFDKSVRVVVCLVECDAVL